MTLESECGARLPDAYRAFVAGLVEPIERLFVDAEVAQPGWAGRPRVLFDAAALGVEERIAGVGTAPRYRVLRLFTNVAALGDAQPPLDSNVGAIPVARVANGVAIGEDNGDFLYLDPDDGFSVWIYHHDGGDVQYVAPSFETWFGASTSE